MRPVIDLRSDTLTQPSRAMREAIANAAVGDEQKREDPTVNELERRGAEFLGHEEAVFLPTATMANQIALNILGRPGDALLVERHAHIMLSELGGPAAHSGLLTIGLEGTNGRFSPDQVVAEIRDRTSVHVAPTRVVTIENTHNSSGGLACPLGALIAGSAELMAQARRGKHYFGGAMRQAGIVAAAALYALDHHVERLAEDHRRARRLADGLAEAGLPVDPSAVDTNFVGIDVGSMGIDAAEARERIASEGVLVGALRPGVLRV